MTHITDEDLSAYALDEVEAGTRGAIDAHLEACASCRASLAGLREALDATATLPVPDRDDEYGARVWAAIEPRLGAAPRRRRVPRLTPWLAAAAVVCVAAGAYWIGQRTATREGASEAPVTAAAEVEAPAAIRERVVLAALGEHFDRTERTLVELVNAEPGGLVDISAEQAWARDLLEANRLYRQAARDSEAPALTSVLDDLEPVLLELANSPGQLTSDEFRALRGRIEARSLVFKVRVTGADVRARQRAILRPGEL